MGESSINGYEIGTNERLAKCRDEMETEMQKVLAIAVERGWCEIEAAVALADAVDDHVLSLARKPMRRH